MLQRAQSLYLGAVCIAMVVFLNALPYSLSALLSATNPIIGPIHVLLTYPITIVAAYAIRRHNNRKLQLRLISGINFMLILLVILVFCLIKQANGACFLDGLSTYKVSIIWPCIALIANLLARYHIKSDEQLVNEDHLR